MNRLFLIFLVILLPLSGCVGKATYDKKVIEADQLSQALNLLAKDYNDLKSEHEQLKSQHEKLEIVSKATEADLQRAQRDIRRLEDVLSKKSIETGDAMSEMRKEIDRLEIEKRDLELAVESEKIARQARIAQMQSTYNELVEKMEAEIKRGEITISELQGELTVNMVDKILFPSGSATIKPEGLKVLEKVGDIVKGVLDKDIQVEGHTDNVPISSRLADKFPSNWELSTARATSVVNFMRTLGIPGERLSAVGYGQYRPVADNDSEAGRAQNRRIQIVLVPPKERFVKKPVAAP